MGLTREEAKKSLVNLVKDVLQQNKKRIEIDLKLIDKICDDFEEELKRVYKEGIKDEARCNKEELKKAYIEGGNDVWKALNCKELAK